MEQPTVEIIICMGSSCFSRGNKKVLGLIKDFLKEKNLEQRVIFKGAHCFGLCESGPVIKINETVIRQVDASNIGPVLEPFFEQSSSQG